MAAYFNYIFAFVGAHMAIAIFLVFTRIMPKLGLTRDSKIEGNGFTKAMNLFSAYATRLGEEKQRSWDYYYARLFPYLHLLALALIAAVIVDVGLRNLDGQAG